ncbi:UNKNOWN [Stylonychia lemnae]|uniref:Uncharacterized protein n=1 Tax=Stylonychia lemnae TaxID=5949 RepID=A0A078ADI2_STYLE|nr:UNKNOWN [Stylonychia lemnae]|eukprot:CDW78923.1 UNKNOWN [Stylonychia lemnae]
MLSQVKDSRFKNSKSPISIKDNIIIQSPIIVKEFIKKQVKDGENKIKKFPRDNVGNKDRLVIIKPSESQINSQSIYNSIADKLNKMSSITSIKSSERKAININAMLSSQQESLTQLDQITTSQMSLPASKIPHLQGASANRKFSFHLIRINLPTERKLQLEIITHILMFQIINTAYKQLHEANPYCPNQDLDLKVTLR